MRFDTFLWARFEVGQTQGQGSIQNVGDGGVFVRSSTLGETGDEVRGPEPQELGGLRHAGVAGEDVETLEAGEQAERPEEELLHVEEGASRLVPVDAIERVAREVESLRPAHVGLTGGGAPDLAARLESSDGDSQFDTVGVQEFDAWAARVDPTMARY